MYYIVHITNYNSRNGINGTPSWQRSFADSNSVRPREIPLGVSEVREIQFSKILEDLRDF